MKISSIKPINIVSSHKVAEKRDIDWFVENACDFKEVSCPGCGSKKTEIEFKKSVVSYLVCKRCGCNYISPRPTARLLAQFYKNSANYSLSASKLFNKTALSREKYLFEPRYEALVANRRALDKDAGLYLDVGAGFGGFCELLKKKNFKNVLGIEPNIALAQSCLARGIKTICKPYERVRLDSKMSAITAFEIIEHVYSPNHFLNWCSENLEEGGILFLTTPDISGFETTVLGESSDCFGHEHLNLFSSPGLEGLLRKHKFLIRNSWSSGELDVQIVQRRLKTFSDAPECLGGFLSNILASGSPDDLNLLQDYLKKSGKTSHVSVIAEKK